MRRKEPQKLSDLIPRVLHDSQMDYQLAEVRVVRSWSSVVGSMAAKYTKNVSIRNGIVSVYITSAALKNELFMSRRQIVERLNEVAGTHIVTDVRFE